MSAGAEPASDRFPRLFGELQLGPVTLPNRVLMAAMSTGMSDARGAITPEQVGYYTARARGGTGLVMVEFACVASEFGISEQRQVVLDSDELIGGHVELVAAITAGGAVPGIQLQVPGQFAHREPGRTAVAPSDVRSRRDGSLRARELEGDEILLLVERFADAATRAVLAGYEVLELHGAHGYLLNAFLSPAMNHRDDDWGGDFERRLAFPTAVVAAVKRAIGERPLLYRLSADEYVAGGLGIDDIVEIVPRLVAAGVDGIDVSTGSIMGSLERTIDPMSQEGWRFPLARRIREVAGVPVAGIGARWPAAAEAALERGDVDLIALGRPLLADADWTAKAKHGRVDAIRPCTSCNWCSDRVFKELPTGCAENPRIGHELEPLAEADAGAGRHIVVVGGGPGGLAAAVQARMTGFEVTLFEREQRLGGGLISSAAPPHKETLLWYRDYLVRAVQSSGARIRTGVEASAADVLALQPHAVILATGATAVGHEIPGEEQPNVASAYSLLMQDRGPVPVAGPAVVYGGGETGCETAELLAADGLEVTLISRSGAAELARAAEPLYRKVLLSRLKANGRIALLTDTHLTEITDGAVSASSEGSTAVVSANAVVLAQGRRAEDRLYRELTEHGLRCFLIGDARQIARIGEAVHQADAALRELIGAGVQAPAA